MRLYDIQIFKKCLFEFKQKTLQKQKSLQNTSKTKSFKRNKTDMTTAAHARLVMADLAQHEVMLISDIAGCPQTFLASECVAYAKQGEPVEADERSMGCPATLVPTKAVIVAFVVDRAGNTFVWHDSLFAARAEFNLEQYVGADSIVYGFVLHDKDRPGAVVRLFDACRLHGTCLLGLNCFERFGRLFEGMSATSRSRTSAVRLHWVWTEGWIKEFVMNKPTENLHGLDCEWQSAIRLPDHLSPTARYHVLE